MWYFRTVGAKMNQEKMLKDLFNDLGGAEGFKAPEEKRADDKRPMFVTYIPQVKTDKTLV